MWKKCLSSTFVILMFCKVYAYDFGYSQLMSIPAATVDAAMELDPTSQLPLVLMPNHDSVTHISGLSLIALENDKLASTIWQKPIPLPVDQVKFTMGEKSDGTKRYIAYTEKDGSAHISLLNCSQKCIEHDITPAQIQGQTIHYIDIAATQDGNTLYLIYLDGNSAVQLYQYTSTSSWRKMNQSSTLYQSALGSVPLRLINNQPYLYVNYKFYRFNNVTGSFESPFNFDGSQTLGIADFHQCLDDHHLCVAADTLVVDNIIYFMMYNTLTGELECSNSDYTTDAFVLGLTVTASGDKAYLAYVDGDDDKVGKLIYYKAAMVNLNDKNDLKNKYCGINDMGNVMVLTFPPNNNDYTWLGNAMKIVDPTKPKQLNHYGYYISTFVSDVMPSNLYISAMDCANCQKSNK